MCGQTSVTGGDWRVAAMRWYSTQAELTLTVTSALALISSSDEPEVVAELMAANMIASLVNAVDRHKRKQAIAGRGLAGLGNLMLTGGAAAV